MADYHRRILQRDGSSTSTSGNSSLLSSKGLSEVHVNHVSSNTSIQSAPSPQSSVWKIWWLEIAAICMSLTALAGLVILLYPYRELRAIPDWPASITLNTAISIITVFLRGGLVIATAEALSQQKWIWFRRERSLLDLAAFDKASRGPFSSMLFYFNMSSWSTLGSYGASLMVVFVALGPFMQQLIRFENCLLPNPQTNATIPRQRFYYPKSLKDASQDPPTSLQSSIYAALFAPQLQQLTGTCSSRNCSFTEPYHTLGYCSSCQDLSNQLTTTIYNGSSNNVAVYGYNFTLPSGFWMQTENAGFSYSMAYKAGSDDDTEYHEIIYAKGNNMTGQSGLSPLQCSAEQLQNPQSSWTCRDYGAARCILHPCVKTYMAELTDGIVQERLLNSTSIVPAFDPEERQLSDYPIVNVPCLDDAQRESMIEEGYKLSDDWVLYNKSLDAETGTWKDVRGPSNSTVPPRCLYQTSYYTRVFIHTWMSSILNGNVTTSMTFINGPSPLLAIYGGGNLTFARVDQVFHNLSVAITANMRQAGNASTINQPQNVSDIVYADNTAALGVVLDSDTCVQVRWPWLAYSAALIVLTVIFLAYTIFQTSTFSMNSSHSLDDKHELLRDPSSAWKSSLLPLLYHGLEDQVLRSQDPSRLVSEAKMKHMAEHTRVRLDQGNDGWKLRHVD